MAGGRPTRYKAEFAEQAYKLCLLGHTDAELAGFFEVRESTINNWKKAHPEFLESLRNGREPADAEVAVSLNKRARGYSYTEVKEECNEDGEVIKRTETTKEVPPDTGAAMAWLKNRQRGKWRDQQDVNIHMDPEDWLEAMAEDDERAAKAS